VNKEEQYITVDLTKKQKVITDAGIIPGIKVDASAKDMAGHPVGLHKQRSA
jgi:fructose-bisphosphate aldolase class 1